MNRLSDEELVLYYYGEAPNPEEIERRLESSTEENGRRCGRVASGPWPVRWPCCW
jgi:hypothetical protein